MRADITVRDEVDLPIAVVEVKNPARLTPETARYVMEPWLQRRYLPPYLLVVSQDLGYLWTGEDVRAGQLEPRVFPMGAVVERYRPEAATRHRLYPGVLELLVLQWLMELSAGASEPDEEVARVLSESGLLDDLRNSYVRLEEAA